MERPMLKAARTTANLTQQGLANLLGTTQKTVSRWERGTQRISAYYRERLQERLNYRDEHLPELDSKAQDSQPVRVDVKIETSDSHSVILESSRDNDMNRRQFNSTVAAGITAAIVPPTLVSSTQLLQGPFVEPDEYLALTRSSLPTWWQWLRQGNYHELDRVLSDSVPVLRRLATTQSPFQRSAARLALETRLMQINLVTGDCNFSQREDYCTDAVHLAALTGDVNLKALALYWQGDTFTYCYRLPETAINHLTDALSLVDGNTSLRCAIYSDLSIVHAQRGDESAALDFAIKARQSLPSIPSSDPFYQHIGLGSSELDQFEGKAYLYLADHLPSSTYSQQAYDAFHKSTSSQSTGLGYRRQALIRKADAARLVGDMRECVSLLRACLDLSPGVMIHRLRLSQIQDVLTRVPSKWQIETPVQSLQTDISYALTVAR